MSEFSANIQRYDPYKNFKFRVVWNGRVVAGVSKVTILKRTREPIERRSDNSKPGRSTSGQTKYEAITLERGITHDPEFERWATKSRNLKAGLDSEASLRNYRKEIRIEMYNELGQLVETYRVIRCWVSEYQAVPELDANGNAVAIEMIKLENEGWERDDDVTEPSEPEFT